MAHWADPILHPLVVADTPAPKAQKQPASRARIAWQVYVAQLPTTPFTATSAAALWGVIHNTARCRLCNLMRLGVVVKFGNGEYIKVKT